MCGLLLVMLEADINTCAQIEKAKERLNGARPTLDYTFWDTAC
jgi:hypothetical protein